MSESGLTKEGAREALEFLHNENTKLQSQLKASQIREQVLRDTLCDVTFKVEMILASHNQGSSILEGHEQSTLESVVSMVDKALTQSTSTNEWIRKSDLIPLDGKYFIVDVVGYESNTASRVGEEYENDLDTFKLYRIRRMPTTSRSWGRWCQWLGRMNSVLLLPQNMQTSFQNYLHDIQNHSTHMRRLNHE